MIAQIVGGRAGMRAIVAVLCGALSMGVGVSIAQAQATNASATTSATSSESSSPLQWLDLTTKAQGLTDSAEPPVVDEENTKDLFAARPAHELTMWNAFAYLVQQGVAQGVRPNTTVLILLLPFLATIFAFAKHIIGMPSLEMLVPIALSISLLATGLLAGLALLAVILFGTFLSRFLLRRIRIMQVPKRAMSLLIVAMVTFGALFLGVLFGLGDLMSGLSIFPILLFLILSDRITAVQLQSDVYELVRIIGSTVLLGVVGYALLASTALRDIVLVYPEVILLLVPINILIGRYLGLRLSEYIRFADVKGEEEE